MKAEFCLQILRGYCAIHASTDFTFQETNEDRANLVVDAAEESMSDSGRESFEDLDYCKPGEESEVLSPPEA